MPDINPNYIIKSTPYTHSCYNNKIYNTKQLSIKYFFNNPVYRHKHFNFFRRLKLALLSTFCIFCFAEVLYLCLVCRTIKF